MNFGISASTFPSSFGPIMISKISEKDVKNLVRLGFSHIDLFIKSPEENGLNKVISKILANDLKISIIAAVSLYLDSGLSLSNPDRDIRERLLESIKKQIILASELNSSVPIGMIRGKGNSENSHYFFAKSIEVLYKQASKYDVPLLLEPVNRYESLLVNSTADAIDFLNKYNLPPLGLLLDTFHMNIEDANFRDSIKASHSRVGHVHLVDSNRKVPGLGHLNWNEIVGALAEIGYKGICSFEAIPGKEPFKEAKMGIIYSKKVFDKYEY